MPHPPVVIDPPLVPGEVEFIAAFTESGVRRLRRVWPGQPPHRCPWRPSADGRHLELDDATAAHDPDGVAAWLRFLSREFLAPSTAASLDTALSHGLRGGHHLAGEVVLPDQRRVCVELGRITEVAPPPPPPVQRDAVVLDLATRRQHQTER